MRTFMHSVFVAAALAVSSGAIAQDPPPPDELEPAVDTSAPSQSSDADMTSAPAVPPPAAPAPTPPPAAPQPAAGASAQPTPAPPRSGARVMDRLELEATQITGNRELPKVLYIVPWKRSDLGDLVGRPVNSLLDEVLAPVDRDVFKRENRYYTALQPGEAGAAGASDAAAAPPARDER